MPNYIVHGCRETVFSVTDIERVARIYIDIGGWEVIHSGCATTKLASFWGLPQDVLIDELVICKPGKKDGVLRLVKFHDVEQKQIRSSAQSWDSGGIFDIDVLVHDVDAKLRELQSLGYHAYADPVTWQFGELTVRHVLVLIDDGICHAMIQRIAPPLNEEQADFSGFSSIFNSSQIVDSLEQSHSFFTDTLGFKEQFHESWTHAPENGANIFGIPRNIARQLSGHAIGYSPDGLQGGSLEIVWLKELEGQDFAHLAVPPNLGVLMQRFPVENLSGFVARLEDKGVPLAAGPGEVPIAPQSETEAVAIRSPNGSWLEFYEHIT